MTKLTPKQEAFAVGIAKGLTQSASYRLAFPHSQKWKDQSVWTCAAMLINVPQVQRRVDELKAKAALRNDISVERVLKEIARLAFFDIRKLVNADGSLIAIKDLDDDSAAAIAGIDIASVGNKDIGVGEVVKFKLADKKGSLELLARHLGMLNDKLKVDGEIKLTAMDDLFTFLAAGAGRIVPGQTASKAIPVSKPTAKAATKRKS